MEDVLDFYHELYDQNRPVICFDETSKHSVDTNATFEFHYTPNTGVG